jgi:hypothetical protein
MRNYLIKFWLGVSISLVLAFAARADNYEMSGTVVVNGQTLPFYFRWDSGRWMICESIDKSNPLYKQYEQICLSCDGNNLITFNKNNTNYGPASLVPYQAEVKSGSFPDQDTSFFGAIVAAIEPSILTTDLNRRVCQIIYPSINPDVCDRCATNYDISLTSPSAFQKILSVTTDKRAVAGTPLTNGWEILHAEITCDASKLAKQFTIKYQNPDFNGSDPSNLKVIYDILGTISKYKPLTAGFDGWPPIDGKTSVADHRTINSTNPFTMTYLTGKTWVTNANDPLQMSAVQSNFLASVHRFNERSNTGRWALAIFCANAVVLAFLLARWLAKKRTETTVK